MKKKNGMINEWQSIIRLEGNEIDCCIISDKDDHGLYFHSNKSILSKNAHFKSLFEELPFHKKRSIKELLTDHPDDIEEYKVTVPYDKISFIKCILLIYFDKMDIDYDLNMLLTMEYLKFKEEKIIECVDSLISSINCNKMDIIRDVYECKNIDLKHKQLILRHCLYKMYNFTTLIKYVRAFGPKYFYHKSVKIDQYILLVPFVNNNKIESHHFSISFDKQDHVYYLLFRRLSEDLYEHYTLMHVRTCLFDANSSFNLITKQNVNLVCDTNIIKVILKMNEKLQDISSPTNAIYHICCYITMKK